MTRSLKPLKAWAASVAPPPASGRFGKLDLGAILLLLIIGAFEVATVQNIESFSSDGSIYMVLAKNIRTSGQYAFNFEPHTVYPPGFPLLLASLTALTGEDSYGFFVRTMPIFSTLALIVWYFVLRRDSGPRVAAACCLLVAATGSLYWLVTTSVMSDAPFLLATAVALWCLQRLDRPGAPARFRRYSLMALCCASVVFAVLLRSFGVALCAGLAVWALTDVLLHRSGRSVARRTAILASILGFAVFFAWLGWCASAEQRVYAGQHMESYASQFLALDPYQPELGTATAAAILLRPIQNLPGRAATIAGIALRWKSVLPAWHSPPVLAVLVLLCCGLISGILGNRQALLAWYFLAYLSVHLLWPFTEGVRLMLPAMPLALAFIWQGARVLTSAFLSRPKVCAGAAFIASACFSVLATTLGASPGLQARAALVFWPVAAISSGVLLLWVVRTGEAGAVDHLNSWVVRFRPLFGKGAAAAFALLMGMGGFYMAQNLRANLRADASSFRHYPSTSAADWLRSAKEGTVMAQQVEIVHRLTGRKVAPFPITNNQEIIAALLARGKVRYLVVNDEVPFEFFLPTEEERLRHFEAAYPSALHLVYRGPGTRIFELERPARPE